MTQERELRTEPPGVTPPGEGRRWLLVRIGVWVGALLLLAWAAWGVVWMMTNLRFEMPEPPEASETLPSSTVPPEPSPAPAPYMSPEGRAITNPAWVRAPQPEFPRAAMEAGVEGGVARVTCRTDADGLMQACEVTEETPPGVGFGAQAVKAALKAQIRPRLVDGQPVASEVAFTVRYRLD